jgi:hypothetical protein
MQCCLLAFMWWALVFMWWALVFVWKALGLHVVGVSFFCEAKAARTAPLSPWDPLHKARIQENNQSLE